LHISSSIFQAQLTLGFFMPAAKTGQYHQQRGYTFPVSVVSHGQQAGQLSSAPSYAMAGKIKLLC